jgi:hypothetical protein
MKKSRNKVKAGGIATSFRLEHSIQCNMSKEAKTANILERLMWIMLSSLGPQGRKNAHKSIKTVGTFDARFCFRRKSVLFKFKGG